MKVTFFWHDPESTSPEKPFKSPSKIFLSSMKEQLKPFFLSINHLFPTDVIKLVCSKEPVIDEENQHGQFNDVWFNINPGLSLFTFVINWSDKVNNLLPPDHVVDAKGLIFKINSFPSNQELIKIAENNKEILEGLNKIIIKKNFKFKYSEKPGLSASDIQIRIISNILSIELEKTLGEIINEWNQPAGENEAFNSKPIHDLWLNYSSLRVTVFNIDLGRSGKQGLEFILDKLDQSNLIIEKVIVE